MDKTQLEDLERKFEQRFARMEAENKKLHDMFASLIQKVPKIEKPFDVGGITESEKPGG
ncbi:hypothetical protein A2U01_0026844, partial [Trifolium medium]|nr:hypothetical protein [Trifolium medium]